MRRRVRSGLVGMTQFKKSLIIQKQIPTRVGMTRWLESCEALTLLARPAAFPQKMHRPPSTSLRAGCGASGCPA